MGCVGSSTLLEDVEKGIFQEEDEEATTLFGGGPGEPATATHDFALETDRSFTRYSSGPRWPRIEGKRGGVVVLCVYVVCVVCVVCVCACVCVLCVRLSIEDKTDLDSAPEMP